MVTIIKRSAIEAVETANFFKSFSHKVEVFFDKYFNEYIIKVS